MKKTKDFNSKMHVGAGPVSAHTLKARLNNGITLIALIITIIVMLILVSVTISMAVNGGLFEYAGKAVSDTENAINAEQELAGGQVQIDGEWYDSIDDYLAGVESVKSLQEKHEFTYYSSLGKAVTDVNNNTRANADANKENAVAGIYTEDGKHTVVLLKDTTEETRVEAKVDMSINLGGKTFKCNDQLGINAVSANINIDGRLAGSTVEITHTDSSKTARAIQVKTEAVCTINGGTYVGNSKKTSGDTSTIYVAGTLTINNASVMTSGETSGISEGCYINAGGKAIISNCKIFTVKKGKGIVYSIENNR